MNRVTDLILSKLLLILLPQGSETIAWLGAIARFRFGLLVQPVFLGSIVGVGVAEPLRVLPQADGIVGRARIHRTTAAPVPATPVVI